MIRGYKQYTNSVISAQAELNQKLDFITPGLSIKVFASTTRNSYSGQQRSTSPFYYSISYYDKLTDTYTLRELNPNGGREDLDYTAEGNQVSSSYYYEASLNYNRTFREKHNITGLLVGVLRENKSGGASSIQTSLPARNIGLSGRFTYAYDGRYFAEANFGYNGSERFAKNERFGLFPSIGAGWMISEEKFWNQDLKNIINKLKLKGTYGLVGNDNIGAWNDRFFYMSEVNLNGSGANFSWGQDFERNVGTIDMIRYRNDKIKWEIAQKMNLGLEVGLFNIFDIQFDYFTEYRKNIFGERQTIPYEMGFSAESKAITLIADILRPEAFYNEKNLEIYATLQSMYRNGQKIDIITVKEELARRGKLEFIGGPYTLAHISGRVASSAHLEYHARILKQKYIRRETILGFHKLLALAADETTDIDDTLADAHTLLDRLENECGCRPGHWRNAASPPRS